MNIINNHGTKINILGIPADRGRWLLIPLGMTILLCLGSVYSWSIFRTPLEKELGISASASLLPFTFILVFYAAVMPIAGFYIPRIGTRLMTAVGGMIVGLGYILSSFATNVTTLVMKLPPQGWHPRQNMANSTSILASSYPKNLLRSRSFYGLWICYVIGTLVGLSAIGISSTVGEEIINIDPTVAASSVSLFALFNGVSRPLFGWLVDRFKPHYIAILSYVLILIACILMVNAQTGQVGNYLIAFCLFWFCLGGWLAMAPTITLGFFNPEQYAQNYGIVFTAYGVGALIGTLATGRIRDLFGTYTYVFYPMAFLAMIGIIVACFLLKKERF
ncbi:putative MFS-type transporter YhjX [Planktothrix agardhii]|uniref:Major facilitator superfamily MFS_1 n=1 Tax=Planktothrix agardhii TaxID=1160 RepID=A0A1J1JG34_PLAAG|nr:MFS transporter [Planktothrix agardhii]CAD5941608.1 putative MFS-type transporter YhjX [Planktothrix agardhii]CUM60347.1 Major facilitator superfamily MFS_1 [Planktothrix agardhii]